MRVTILSDICEISSGGTPSRNMPNYYQGDIPWVKISDIENAKNGVINDTEEKISIEGLKSINNKLFPKGTLLFAMYGSIGKVGIAGRELSTNQAILGIRPKSVKQVDINYLKFWFKTNRQRLINQGRGVALKNLSATIIRNLIISLPPKNHQIRIATILTKAEALIAIRKESITALDELLKSIFLEMFGDPLKNKKGWKKDRLKNLCGFITKGTTPKGKDIFYSYENELIPFVKVYHICNDGTINFDFNPSFVTQKTHNEYLKRSIVYPKDILMNIVGPPLGKIGIVPELYKEWNVNQAIAIFRCGIYLNPKYLLFVLKSKNFCDSIINMAVGIRQLNLSLEQCREIKIPVPPINLQNQFVAIVEKVEAIKAEYTQSLNELENLYNSFSYFAFKDELDLNNIFVYEEMQYEEPEMKLGETKIRYEPPEIKTQKQFSEKELKKHIKQKTLKSFTFNELLEDINNKFNEIPDYDRIKKMVFDMLDGKKPTLTQTFDHDKKEIILKVKV